MQEQQDHQPRGAIQSLQQLQKSKESYQQSLKYLEHLKFVRALRLNRPADYPARRQRRGSRPATKIV